MLRINDSQLQRLHAYWTSKRGGRIAPARGEIFPEEIPDLLPWVYLIDMVGTPPRFRFRLAGTGIVREFGEEITGKFLDEIDLNGVNLPILSEYASVASAGEPVASAWHFTKHDGRELTYEHLILPLSSDGERVDMLLGAAVIRGVGPLRRPVATKQG